MVCSASEGFARASRTLCLLPGQTLQLGCLLLTLLLGSLDLKTGYEMSFSVFYLMPVAIIAWCSPGRSCYLHAVLAALVWDVANLLAGQMWSHPAIYVWNGLTRAVFYVITAALIQQVSRLLAREQAVSRTDHLTGLLNSRGFAEAFDTEQARSLRTRRTWSLLCLDLDYFKEVNDQYGHSEGDRALREVGLTLRQNLRCSDAIARSGGDEFVILLPETDQAQAGRVGEKIVRSIEMMSRRHGWPVTSSVGVFTPKTSSRHDLETVIRSADKALYQAKRRGRNQVSIFGDCDVKESPEGRELVKLSPA